MRAQEAYRLQLRCFLGLVQEQRHLPSLKQLLKLYTAISLPKLASLMDLDEPTLRSQLILLKVPPFYYNPSLQTHTHSSVLWPFAPSYRLATLAPELCVIQGTAKAPD